jgi:anti-sigma factor RsiW
MSVLPVTEEELHAYLDGQLDTWRQAEVRALLEAQPAVAARLAAWRRDAEGLRAALAGIETWPPNPSLDPAVIRRRMRTRSLATIGRALCVSLALGLAVLIGWSARSAYPPAHAPLPMQDAVDAYRAFAVPFAPRVELPAGRGSLPTWMASGLGLAHPLALPDLSRQGFRALGARLLASSEGVAAMALYEADNGRRITFYLRPSHHFSPDTPGWAQEGGLTVRYWYRGGYAFALIGPADDPRTREIERTFPQVL